MVCEWFPKMMRDENELTVLYAPEGKSWIGDGTGEAMLRPLSSLMLHYSVEEV